MRASTNRPGARLVSLRQASEELGISIDALDRLVATGQLRTVELPGIRRRFLLREDLETSLAVWTKQRPVRTRRAA